MAETTAAQKKRPVDFEDDNDVDQALGAAVMAALRRHKRLGQSVVVWQDGQVVTVAPEDIPVGLADEKD